MIAALASTPTGCAQTFTLLYTFTGGTDGAIPVGGLTLDPTGNLYGTAESGVGNEGSVFKINRDGKFTVLHSFGPGGKTGAHPVAGLVRDSAGNLYGTTSGGGSFSEGTVFELPKQGKFKIVHNFSAGSDGSYPAAPMIFDASGNLYGTTVYGGTSECADGLGQPCGVIFKIDPNGKETVPYRFARPKRGGDFPYAGLIQDSSGNFYGTTLKGGADNLGTVFKFDTSHHETALYSFHGLDGEGPFAGLVQDANGNLYGTTAGGGNFGLGVFGTVFKIDPQGNETVLYNFTGGADGASPYGTLIMDAAGNLYGTTAVGGQNNGIDCFGGEGCGVVFKLDPSGNETVLHSFTETDGATPEAGLIMDSAGNLYGTTDLGGLLNDTCPGGCGVVFKITP